MIIKLTGKNNLTVQEYLAHKPLFSQFLESIIKNYGYDTIILNVFGCYDENKNLVSIFAVMANNLFVYSDSDYIPAREILDYLNENSINFMMIKGEENLLKKFEKYINFTTKYLTNFCKLEKQSFTPKGYGDITIEKAIDRDNADIVAFFNKVPEFKRLMNEESIRVYINYGYTYTVIEKGQIVAVAICNSINNRMATINSIATLPEFRRKGYGTKLLSYLCYKIFDYSQSISVCYDNPTAIHMYKAVGFKNIGKQGIYIK
ncbi:MAG: GNAT family N-acetyltransferase [Lachnospirales bacterium]